MKAVFSRVRVAIFKNYCNYEFFSGTVHKKRKVCNYSFFISIIFSVHPLFWP